MRSFLFQRPQPVPAPVDPGLLRNQPITQHRAAMPVASQAGSSFKVSPQFHERLDNARKLGCWLAEDTTRVADSSISPESIWESIVSILDDENRGDDKERFTLAFGVIRSNGLDASQIFKDSTHAFGSSILHKAIDTGSKEVVEFVLSQMTPRERNDIINYYDYRIHADKGCMIDTPLIRASTASGSEQTEIIELLLSYGADIRLRSTNSHREILLPIHTAAASQGSLEAFKLICQRAHDLIDVKAEGPSWLHPGYTPLMIALKDKQFAKAIYLLENYSLDLGIQNDNGQTAAELFSSLKHEQGYEIDAESNRRIEALLR